LKAEKEMEIEQYVQSLEAMKGDISTLKFTYEKQSGRKNEIEEEKKDLTENLKKI
jgi:hypothetical protein